MKKTQLLNSQLSNYIGKLGHKDMTCIADAGLPIPPTCERIDLAIERGLPTLFQVIKAIDYEAIFEKVIIASELTGQAAVNFLESLHKILGPIKVETVTHAKLKQINAKKTKAIIRTGDNRAYHNIILVSGVKL